MRPITFIFFFFPLWCVSQTAPNTFWVQFTDKTNTPYSIDQPQQFLSERAIQRRITQGIAIEENDLPVDPNYIAQVLAQGEVQLHNKSKWLNAITIRTSDFDALVQITLLPFVQQIKRTDPGIASRPVPNKFPIALSDPVRDLDYGASFVQVSMMNGHLLHELSQGEGMMIGVLDSGFDATDVVPAFDALRDRDGIVLTRDLVAHDGDIYSDHWHGRSVLSCMAATLDGQLIGTAPEADYVLLRTEDTASEFIVEEDNWIAGAELCDSIGCDVINTSLGYTRFDDPDQDHSYSDLDGNTTRISIAAGIASSKGIIPVNSAGNSGQNDWYYISAAADAFNILAVGATGAEGQPAPFSSYGPSFDGRVKPDVSAMGWGTAGLGIDGVTVEAINGTSFSSPLVAGLVACLWKLHPLRTNLEIMDAVRRSASHYDAPEVQLGYGIPDLMLAHELLVMSTEIPQNAEQGSYLHVFPMPFNDRMDLIADLEGQLEIMLIDQAGRMVWNDFLMAERGARISLTDPKFGELVPGLYLLKVSANGRNALRKVVKAG